MAQDRISIVTACMNREENLLKVMPSWLNSHADEIVIVDWSCSNPLHKTLKSEGIDDERIVVYRVDEEDRWVLTHAYNVGLKRASNGKILKLDNDHSITGDFFEKNTLSDFDTRLGSWRLAKSEDQAYINGAFLIRSEALASVGYFNETITTYGWDDSYLHESLFANGAKIGHLCPESIRHIEQEEESRTRFQAINREGRLAASVGVKTTEFMNRRNMYLSALLPRQTKNTRQATYKVIDNSKHGLHILKRQTSPHQDIPTTYLEQADRLAFRDFYCWKHGMTVENTCIQEVEDKFISSASPIEPELQSARENENPLLQHDSKELIHVESRCELTILSKVIPFMLSAYGHTDNTRKHQLILDQDKSLIDAINDVLPDWSRDKVIAVSPANAEPERLSIDTSRMAASNLIGRLVLGNEGDNHYFWVAFNCLKPTHKRCLFDFIEAVGKPHQLLANYFFNSSPDSELRRTVSPERFLRSLAAIYPNRAQQSFASFAEAFMERMSSELSKDQVLDPDLLHEICEASNGYSLTLVTSLFKGLRYVVDYALNLKRMNLFGRTEILIYVVPSSEAETARNYLSRFFKHDPNVKVSLLEPDPGLYECWNLGIRNASGKYVSNANADDRRGRYHSDYLIFLSELRELTAVSSALLTDTKLTYAEYSITQDVWFSGMGRSISKEHLFIESDGIVESQNLFHCMPIWSKSIHDKYGYFDEAKYGTSCDWEFWLRCTDKGMTSRLVDIPLGFYLQDPASHNRRHEHRRECEQRIVEQYISTNIKLGELR